MQTESRLPINNIKLASEIQTRIMNGTYTTNPRLYQDDLRKVSARLTHFKEANKKSPRKNTAIKITELEEVLQNLKQLSPVFAAVAKAPAAPAAPAAPVAKAPAAVAKAPLKPVSERIPTPYPVSPSTIEALRKAKAAKAAKAEAEEEDVIVVNNSQTEYVEINHKCPADSNETFELGDDELSDGNCFYSALYHAALHHSQPGLVSNIFTKFGGSGTPKHEEAFIRQLRNGVGDLLVGGIDSEKKKKYLHNIQIRSDIHTNVGRKQQAEETRTFFETLLKSALDGHGAQLQSWISESADEIKRFFNFIKEPDIKQLIRNFLSKYNNVSDSQKFYTDMANIIRIYRVYSSEIDIGVIRYVLEKNKILLEIVSDKASKKCMFLSGMPALWLYREIGSAHYKYFRKSLEAKSRAAAPPTGVKTATAPAAQCQKLYDPCTMKKIKDPNSYQKLLARVLELNDARISSSSRTRKRKLRKSRKSIKSRKATNTRKTTNTRKNKAE